RSYTGSTSEIWSSARVSASPEQTTVKRCPSHEPRRPCARSGPRRKAFETSCRNWNIDKTKSVARATRAPGEKANAQDLGSCAARLSGSNPEARTVERKVEDGS